MLQNVFFGKRWQSLVSLLMFLLAVMANAQCSLTGWKKVEQGENFSIALKEDGTLWFWGLSTYGLGNGVGNSEEIKHPVQIGSANDWKDLSVGSSFALAQKNNGDLYAWGNNGYGQFGLGNQTDLYVPTIIQQNVKAFSAGDIHTMIIKADGTMWGTGYNDWSGLGVGTSNAYYTSWQQEVTKGTDWASVLATHWNSYGIKANGTLWSAGSDWEGQTGLGHPGATETDTFTQIGTDTNWKKVVGGAYHVLGLKSNGELWTWGHNNNGRLGIGTTGNIYRTPQQVVGTDWSSIGATKEASSATKTDGSLWTWGYNSNGKLGIGTTTDVNVPTRVGTGTDWKYIPQRSGANSSAGIKTDGSLWSWGWDGYWQLGNNDGTQTSSSAPTQVTCTDNQLAVNDVASTSKIAIYPNPAKDMIQIKSHQKSEDVKIYAANGTLVKSATVGNNQSLNISDLPAGVYFLKTQNDLKGIKLIKK